MLVAVVDEVLAAHPLHVEEHAAVLAVHVQIHEACVGDGKAERAVQIDREPLHELRRVVVLGEQREPVAPLERPARVEVDAPALLRARARGRAAVPRGALRLAAVDLHARGVHHVPVRMLLERREVRRREDEVDSAQARLGRGELAGGARDRPHGIGGDLLVGRRLPGRGHGRPDPRRRAAGEREDGGREEGGSLVHLRERAIPALRIREPRRRGRHTSGRQATWQVVAADPPGA